MRREKSGKGIGYLIAQRLTAALAGEGIPYDRLSKIVYDECLNIAREQQKGDWISMPNGTEYTLTFKPIRNA